MPEQPRILVVDDHREIRDALARYLSRNGMRADAVADARNMDRLLAKAEYDLVVLDVMMPGEDGLSVCRRLAVDGRVPVLMLTALGEETDRIVGLELGADDYVAKPFNPREVLARIKSILKRAERVNRPAGDLEGRRLGFDRWVLDIDRRLLRDAEGSEVSLTSHDFRLLVAFLERPRRVLSREQLLDIVTGREAAPFDRAIDNQVSRLRRKIERDPARPELIATVWGGGYAFSADVEDLS